MKTNLWKKCMSGALCAAMLTTTVLPSAVMADTKKYTETDTGKGYILVTQEGGETLGYSKESGIQLIEDDGYAFKDLNKNGKLDAYEDWRLSTEERAEELADEMVQDREGIESIAGLMLYSSHQFVPGGTFGGGTYGGKSYAVAKEEDGVDAADLEDNQKIFLEEDNLRHVLLVTVESAEVAAKWNNNAQAFVEGLNFGIPINSSSDPRNTASAGSAMEYDAGNGGTISQWPSSLGMAATFDPELVKKFGQDASIEYRALGIATALSPQIDLATEPRWSRVNGTFGENSALATDMARAYVDGFQTTYNEDGTSGWGEDSVNAMCKHWPSGGPEEGGRDAHYGYGKFAVYPGNNFEEQIKTFTEGAFKLDDGTEYASAVMPYYTISYNQSDENVGNSFSNYIISKLLRTDYDYDGVVCTDWMITADTPNDYAFSGKCWGVEDLTVTQRHYKVLMAGVDQFGGNNDADPIMAAYDLMVQTNGKLFADARFKDSARRLLTNIFNTNLFENPYLDPEESAETVGNSEFMADGYDAQVKSIVMLKNSNNVISAATGEKKTVYVDGVSASVAEKYFNVTDDITKADLVIVGMDDPDTGSGYSTADLAAGGNGYVPISLQYGEYTATTARAVSIASDGGAQFISSDSQVSLTGSFIYTDEAYNRSYKDKTVTASNISELEKLQADKEAAGDTPVVVYMKEDKPLVWSEVEPLADAIVVGFGVIDQAALEVISGTTEPSGLLPMQQPANMETVEAQYEDVPQDMVCYVDADGNTYDFGYGLNWSGVIKDARTAKYVDVEVEKSDAEKLAEIQAKYDKTIATLKKAAQKILSAVKIASVKCTGKNTVKITIKKDSLVTSIKIKYSTSKSMKSAKTMTFDGSSKKVKNLKSGKRYYFQAAGQTEVAGKTVTGPYSSVKSVKVK